MYVLTYIVLLKAGTLLTLKASTNFFSSHVMKKGLVDPNYIYIMYGCRRFRSFQEAL